MTDIRGFSHALPVRVGQFRTGEFAAWLAENGAEISPPTNPYEVIRYRAYTSGSKRAAVSVVYRKGNGLLTFTGKSCNHYKLFLQGKALGNGEAQKSKRTKNAVDAPKGSELRRQMLLSRDGPGCWYCGENLGVDATIEHLVPRSKGGANHLDNYVLAHAACNRAAADKALVEKIALRAEMSAKQVLRHD